MKNYLRCLLLVAPIVFSPAWSAEIPTSKHELPTFGALDKNQDQLISHDEGFGDEDVAKHWDKLDTNRDGNLDPTEFSKLQAVVKREEALKTDHPDVVQQYKNGKYIPPSEQIERNKRESKE